MIYFKTTVFLKSFNFRNTPFTRSCIKYSAPRCQCTKWLFTALDIRPEDLTGLLPLFFVAICFWFLFLLLCLETLLYLTFSMLRL